MQPNNSNTEFLNMDSVTVTADGDVSGPVTPIATATPPYTGGLTSQTGSGDG
jgi:hypothetical protein